MSRRKKLQIVDSLGELFPDFFPQIPIFCWSDPDFLIQLSGRSAFRLDMAELTLRAVIK